MRSFRNAVAVWVRALTNSRHARIWTHFAAWLSLLLILLGWGQQGLLSDGGSDPFLQELVKMHHAAAATTPAWIVSGYHWLWGLWVLVTIALVIHLLLEFFEELESGWKKELHRLEEKTGGEIRSAPSTKPAAATQTNAGIGSLGRIFEADFLAEIIGGAFFRIVSSFRKDGKP